MVACLAWGAGFARSAELTDDVRREFIRGLSATFSPEKDFKDADWFLWTVVFDVDGDGRQDALVASPDHAHYNGTCWIGAHQLTNGNFQLVRGEVCCRSEELYVYGSVSHVPMLMAHDLFSPWKDASGRTTNRDGFIAFNEKKDDIDCGLRGRTFADWLCDARFRRLSRAPFAIHEGFALRETMNFSALAAFSGIVEAVGRFKGTRSAIPPGKQGKTRPLEEVRGLCDPFGC